MLIFKKIMWGVLSPISFCIGVQLLGLYLLCFTRKQRHGLVLVTIGVLMLGLLSFPPLPNALLGFLEHQHPALLIDPASDALPGVGGRIPKWVVVLSGGANTDPFFPANSQLASASLARLVEALRIKNIYPGILLITDSVVMAEVAKIFEVDTKDIVLVSGTRDTMDQARQFKAAIDNDLHFLVTSADHMPRALAMFKKQGMSPIPAPTDFWIKERQKTRPGVFFPSAISLRKTENAYHEILGIIWAKFRNQI